ncbi:hypothetical protein MMC29_006454 [Sticta canariensis]|nr:hypothetical protein [Sticta canariensis]
MPMRKELRDLELGDILGGAGVRNLNERKLERRKAHMSLLKRCKFVLKDSKGFDKLTLKIIECVENLDKMCSWQLALTIRRGVLQVLDEEKNPQALASLSKAAYEMSGEKQGAGENHAGYSLFASITAFKAKLRSLDEIRTIRSYTTSDFNYKKPEWRISGGGATMAIRRKNSQAAGVRLIEWYNYEDSLANHSLTEKSILELAKVLCIAERPPEFRTLTCTGLIQDLANSRYGFVFVPPDYIENITKYPLQVGALSITRKPISLLELIENAVDSNGAPILLDLGIRFRLANKLVHSIYVMHAVGWVHKNIRSSSVLFLPAESRNGGPSKSGSKDMENPFLCGFGRSRPEEASQNSADLYPNISKEEYDDPTDMRPTNLDKTNFDIYHHPYKRLKPMLRSRPAFDIYSLGCVLLELGFYRPLRSFDHDYSPKVFHEHLLDLADELVGRMGSIYAGAVKDCLSIDVGERSQDENEAKRTLCWKVAGALDQCIA